jgi:hypothetical protein
LVWLIRVLMIGSFTLSSTRAARINFRQSSSAFSRPVRQRSRSNGSNKPRPVTASRPINPAPKPTRPERNVASGQSRGDRS